MEVLGEGYRIPLSAQPPLSLESISFISYDPSSIKGLVLEKELLELSSKGTVERAPPSPGFYSRMFVVLKASGSWRPIIDQVLDGDRSVRPGVCQAGGLDDFAGPGRAYFQVLIHLDSKKYLRFVTSSGTFQFKVP